ncbi:Pectin lyase fold/virulence factor [Arthrobotrys flagrans]|uniref:galacturonan 1,4-alpha-galacturonidase n=1 Tax=Arthrobotrys flagrans TaxID=97331 RepID=A0A436ZVS5_ARTFL|nr:Pectin lyase fold/virulence factor [Arthrobotrys flagrans]
MAINTVADLRIGVGFISLLTALATEGTVSHSTTHGCKTCAVYAHKKQKDGKRKDDVPSLLKAFKDCGNGGYIESPAGQNYRIAQRLNPVLHNVKIDWLGTWTFSDDLTYWRIRGRKRSNSTGSSDALRLLERLPSHRLKFQSPLWAMNGTDVGRIGCKIQMDNGPAITQGTSKMLISNVVWANFTGYTNGRSVTRSKVNNLVFEGLDIIDGKTGSVEPERGVEGTGFNNT